MYDIDMVLSTFATRGEPFEHFVGCIYKNTLGMFFFNSGTLIFKSLIRQVAQNLHRFHMFTKQKIL